MYKPSSQLINLRIKFNENIVTFNENHLFTPFFVKKNAEKIV